MPSRRLRRSTTSALPIIMVVRPSAGSPEVTERRFDEDDLTQEAASLRSIPPLRCRVKGVGCIQTVAGNGHATRLLRALAKSRSLRCNHKMHRNHLVAMIAAAGIEAPAETSSRKRPAETSCRHNKSTKGRAETCMFLTTSSPPKSSLTRPIDG